MDLAPDYCKQVEDYLSRRNRGHLVRIVGPAFELVRGWESRGIPLTIVQRGIDRCVERHEAKGPGRRPVRIEFCEADVLDVFDQWRRAVGVPAGDPADAAAPSGDGGGKGGSLPSHLERVIARLTALRAGSEPTLDAVLDAVVRELDAARAASKSVRGEARERLLERLRVLDAELMSAARAQCDEAVLREIEADAAAQLAPFRERMLAEAYAQSREACIARGVRERFRLPPVAYDG